MVKPRISSIETFRVVAAFAVICLHIFPFRFIQGGATAFYLINNSCRFALPFFFLACGYSFGKSLKSGIPAYTLLFRYAKLLSVLYAAWFVIYGLLAGSLIRNIPALGFWKGYILPILNQPAIMLMHLKNAPLEYLLYGPVEHLWFLTAQIFGLTFLTLFIEGKAQKYLILVSILIYLLGLLGGPYSSTPFGIPLGRTLGPIGAITFISAGWWLSGRSTPSLSLALMVLAGGYMAQIAEAFLLWRVLAIEPLYPYLFGTLPFGIGVFLLALALSDTSKTSVLRKIGALTSGIYLIHMLFIREVRFIGFSVNPVMWEIMVPFVTFSLSVAAVLLLRKSRYTRFLV